MTRRRARAGSGVARIGVAIGLASAAGYVLLALVGRLLTPAEFGLFVAFWGVLFGLASSLSTLEQETARRVADSDRVPGPPLGAVTTACAVLATGAAALTLLPPVAARLYGSADSRLGVVVVVATLGFTVQFAVRGMLIGSGRHRDYGGLVVAEALSRLLLLLAFVATVGVSLTTAAIAVGVGSFAWLLWSRHARAAVAQVRTPARQWGGAVRRALSLMVAAALTASLITGYPTMVTALTGAPPGDEGGAVFAALTISRVPLLLVSPVQALAVPAVLRLRMADGAGTGLAMRRRLLQGTALFVVLGAVGAAGGWFLGPWAVRLVYGPAYEVGPAQVAILVLSAFLLAWVLLLSAALVALAAYRSMIAMWSAAAVSTAVWLAWSPWGVVETTAVGALVGPVTAMVCAVPLLWALTAPAAPDGPAAAP